MIALMKRVAVLFLAVFFVASVPSCAAIYSNLPKVIAYAQDAQLVVGAVESFSHAYFQVSPNPDLEKKVDTAIARARAAIDSAIRTADGAGALQNADLDTAFDEFRVAYSDLINLVKPLGIETGSGLKASPHGGLVVPEPLALSFHKRPRF